jgi:rod shape-determining protein MreC
MQKKPSFVWIFLVILLISLAVLAVSGLGILRPVEPIFQIVLAPIQGSVYKGFNAITSVFSNSKLQKLQEQNQILTKKLVDQDKLIEDNKALRDQFDTKDARSANLIPADVVGAPGFLPGFSVPENYTLDKGEADGIKVGDAVIVGSNLLGRIIKVTRNLSNVQLVTSSTASFTAITLETNALGVVRGQGGGNFILDNVVLSDNLKIGDMVLSKGSVDVEGNGIFPGLVVGKITAVSKNPSDLFQRAKIESAIDFSKVNKVFVVNTR